MWSPQRKAQTCSHHNVDLCERLPLRTCSSFARNCCSLYKLWSSQLQSLFSSRHTPLIKHLSNSFPVIFSYVYLQHSLTSKHSWRWLPSHHSSTFLIAAFIASLSHDLVMIPHPDSLIRCGWRRYRHWHWLSRHHRNRTSCSCIFRIYKVMETSIGPIKYRIELSTMQESSPSRPVEGMLHWQYRSS